MSNEINMSVKSPVNTGVPSYTPIKIDNTANSALPKVTSVTQMNQMEREGQYVSIGESQLVKVIGNAIKAMEGPERAFEVSIHKQTHTIMVKVLNKDTGELIREIPPEKTLDIVAKMMEVAGILIDERV
ncbi:flagellar protein FlaG [Paenibacillus glacialis]|uniref:Flagellar biosynthesis protein FlaG n=1 Tax=Paenibacillus glacialis TaxID=494026 RepID=A0A168L6C7_9BACL|nr:flagellar protein FlaG [Paenibacillus glacialis]OAB42941.1 hypothetical protein PGLA_10825 [Paenibacillus glacialis]